MGRRKNSARTILRALVGSVLAAMPLQAQTAAIDRDARRFGATRGELEVLLQQLPNGTSRLTSEIIRSRLSEGDLQPGDGVALVVDGEPQLTDTFVVAAGREIVLPVVGVVPLRGVLYSELESHLAQRLASYVRSPVVHARGMIRVSVSGAVLRPGFYFVAPDALVSEPVMTAGLTADAKLDRVHVQRGGRPLLDRPTMRSLLAAGRTLDDADVHSGDAFVVPGRRGNVTSYDQVRTLGILLTIPLTIYSLTKIF